MQYVGYLLLLLALVASVVGLLERWKNKRILATPFRRTGEIAANPRVADAQGNVSCEGPVRLTAPAIAPCSGTPCLYYEIEVVQSWTKLVPSENGVKEERGTTTVDKVQSGVVFYVDDGSGPVAVDPREGIDVEMETAFEQSQEVGWGDVYFNGFHAHVPDPGENKAGESVKVIERIVPIDTKLFVCGQLDETLTISKPKGLSGSLIASRRGRSDLIRRTKRNATVGTIAAAILMCPGLALAAFGEPPADDVSNGKICQIVDQSAAAAPCTGKIYGDYGSDVALVVTQPGAFMISGQAPPGKKVPLMAALDVKDESGHAVVANAPGAARVELAPGRYTINVRDRIPGAAKNFKGGFSYELSVTRLAPEPMPVPALAPVAAVEQPAAPSRTPAKAKAPARKKKKAKR